MAALQQWLQLASLLCVACSNTTALPSLDSKKEASTIEPDPLILEGLGPFKRSETDGQHYCFNLLFLGVEAGYMRCIYGSKYDKDRMVSLKYAEILPLNISDAKRPMDVARTAAVHAITTPSW